MQYIEQKEQEEDEYTSNEYSTEDEEDEYEGESEEESEIHYLNESEEESEEASQPSLSGCHPSNVVKCCKCCAYVIVLLLVLLICSQFWAKEQRSLWIKKSNCYPPSDARCYCPHYEMVDDESPFITFDICISQESTIDVSNYQRYLRHTTTLTRNNISAGDYQTENITLRLRTTKLFNNKFITDLFAHIIVSDHPKSNKGRKRYIYNYYVQLTKHEFKESVTTKDHIIRRNMKHTVYLQNQLNISYVVEWGCFDKYYWGNKMLFQNMPNTDEKKWEPYSPISVVYHNFSLQKLERNIFYATLQLSFNPTTIFGFQLQSLVRMDATMGALSQSHAPEMWSFFLSPVTLNLVGMELINPILSYDQFEEIMWNFILFCILTVVLTVSRLLSLKKDVAYWRDANLSMRNVCCVAILIYFIAPVVQIQQAAYVSYIGRIENSAGAVITPTNAAEPDDKFWENFQKRYEFWENYQGHPEQLVGIWIVGICMIFAGLVAVGYYFVFPFLKAVICINLRSKEEHFGWLWLPNNMVGTFETLLGCGVCAVAMHDYTLFRYFLRYIGMGIFVPQIFTNYFSDEVYTVPRLPLAVFFLQCMDDTFQSFFIHYTNFYIGKDNEITKLNILFWCRDAIILLILYLQFKYHGDKPVTNVSTKEKAD